MTLLLTGGLGFIGSHTLVELILVGLDKIVVLDNLANSKRSVLDCVEQIVGADRRGWIRFVEGDIRDAECLDRLFREYGETERPINTVIHFAGLKSVAESIQRPDWYYRNNVVGTLNLLDAMKRWKCRRIIFSSSVTVYGDATVYPADEECRTGVGISNPYSRSKHMIEEILRDYSRADPDLRVIILRYLNPVGAHSSGWIGEDPNGIPNNLCPYILRVASGVFDKLTIYGSDYQTKDGTAERDFIHVVDLARAHVFALNAIERTESPVRVYNVGTGRPVSVLEFVQTFQRMNEVRVPYCFGPRRDGDLPITYARVDRIRDELGWVAEMTLEDICRDAWRWTTINLGSSL